MRCRDRKAGCWKADASCSTRLVCSGMRVNFSFRSATQHNSQGPSEIEKNRIEWQCTAVQLSAFQGRRGLLLHQVGVQRDAREPLLQVCTGMIYWSECSAEEEWEAAR